MYIITVGISHNTAPVEIREKCSLCGKDARCLYTDISGNGDLTGMVLLDTCNRTEIYATTRDTEAGINELTKFFQCNSGLSDNSFAQYAYSYSCHHAIEHLFKIAAGLDSMILGEQQILGQVRESYGKAVDSNCSNAVLNTLFQNALSVGKRVRTETGIDRYPVSVSKAAVDLARNIVDDLSNATVLLIGAGDMSELALCYLQENGVDDIVIANRSFEKAQAVARRFGGRAIHFEAVAGFLHETDIVITCTGATHYLITQKHFEGESFRNGPSGNIVLIDIAVPRNIHPDVRTLPGIYLYDIDDLRGVVDANIEQRTESARKARCIIEDELSKFNKWMASRYVVPIITELKEYGEEIKETELKKAYNRLGDLTPQQKEVIHSMAHSIVNKLLHAPIVTLKEHSAGNQGHLYSEVVKKLFDIDSKIKNTIPYERYNAGNQG